MNPTGSHFPNHCSDCIFSQAAKDLYGTEYALWCVRYEIQVSRWRDACQFWQMESPTGCCPRCGEVLYDIGFMEHDKVCSKSHYGRVKVEKKYD